MIVRVAVFAVGVAVGLLVVGALAVNRVPEMLDELVASTQTNGHAGPRHAKRLVLATSVQF